MRTRLFMLAIAFGVGAVTARANAEAVTFQSGSYADLRQLFTKGPATATATVAATLDFPDQVRDRYPAIVIVHTIGGYLEANEGWHAAQFRKAGFATLTYKSPAARAMSEAAGSGSRPAPPWASAVAEAYGALQLLAKDPQIDARRIAIVGFSFGGEVAHLSAFEGLRVALVPGQMRFAAHVAYYPAGVNGVAAGQGAYTGAPVLMLLGDKDDNLPIPKAEAYLAYARAGSAQPPIDVLIYPGAYHAWTVSSLGAPRFYPQYVSTRKCPYILVGGSRPALLIDGQEKPLEPGVLQSCLREGQGYSMAYDEAIRAQSTRDALAFLLKALRP
jgi:dienelactone hydrolase